MSHKNAGLQFSDRERPCFSREQEDRIKTVLFREFLRPDWPDWLTAFNQVFYELKLDCDDTSLLNLAMTIVQLESGIERDPLLANGDLETMFTERLKQFTAKNPVAARLIAMTGLVDSLQQKLREDTRRGFVIREGDLARYVEEDLRPFLARFLNNTFVVPDAVARLIVNVGVPDAVNTIGPMQVNVEKAYRQAKARGEPIASVAEMRRELLNYDTALVRGLKEGVYMVNQTFSFYRAHTRDDLAVAFTIADYNAGEFSSRNAAFQERVARLSGRTLRYDGDLLIYGADGQPVERPSRTEQAVVVVLPDYGAAAVRNDLKLEKKAQLVETRTWKLICSLYQAKESKPCELGRVPTGAGNELAEIKLGRNYTPADYARGYVRRYRANRRMYDSYKPPPPPAEATPAATVAFPAEPND
ncbi:MAG: DUF1615 family protein [Candidatus Lambdaproteobacteria bacterium]|nr:DUF1615 family protein [Candidatus Lambdaproteobacteria bacterium]